MSSILRGRSRSLLSGLTAVLAASLAACAASSEPPRVATVSTEVPGATTEVTPVVVTPAKGDPAPASAGSAKPNQVAQAKADEIRNELSTLDMSVLDALNWSSNNGTSVLGAGLPAGGVLSGAAMSGGGTGGSLYLGGGGGGGSLNAGSGGTTAAGGAAKVTGPVAAVTVGTPQVSGSRVGNVASVVAGMTAGFRRCLNRALQTDPTSVRTGSKLVVKATLDVNGAVTSAAATGITDLPPFAVTCITKRVSAAQFAPPDNGPSRIEIPVSAVVTP